MRPGTELGHYAPVRSDEQLEDNETEDLDDGRVDLDHETNTQDGSSRTTEKQLLRKIDRRIMPCLVLMIILNYLDRNALANARVQGIEKSLGLIGSQFNTAGEIENDEEESPS